jgi:hypothetical protein
MLGIEDFAVAGTLLKDVAERDKFCTTYFLRSSSVPACECENENATESQHHVLKG